MFIVTPSSSFRGNAGGGKLGFRRCSVFWLWRVIRSALTFLPLSLGSERISGDSQPITPACFHKYSALKVRIVFVSVCVCVCVFSRGSIVKVAATNVKKRRKFWFHHSCPGYTQRPFIRPDELQILQTVSHCVSVSYLHIEALHPQQHIGSTLCTSENPNKTHSRVNSKFYSCSAFTPLWSFRLKTRNIKQCWCSA